MRDLRGASVVVTGASSGIGRATALAFARRGARVVLAARRGAVLEEVAQDCERVGGEAIVAPTDVTDAEAVAALARKAEEAFGGIDVWVNNAGAGVFGAFTEAPLDLHRRTIEINLFGAMYGAYAALPVFLRQRHGILINTISMGAWVPNPFAAAYTASKFGLRGFAASVRQELGDCPDIHVCGVFPTVVDTPGLTHIANSAGRRINPGPLLYAPEDVAEAIIGLARSPRDEVAVGWPARAAQAAYALARGPTERLIGAAVRYAYRQAGPTPRTDGALRHPVPQGTEVSGGWREHNRVPSARPASLAAGAVLLLGATAALAYARTGSRRRR